MASSYNAIWQDIKTMTMKNFTLSKCDFELEPLTWQLYCEELGLPIETETIVITYSHISSK